MHFLSSRFNIAEDALKPLTGVEAEFLSDYIRKTTHHYTTCAGSYCVFSQSLSGCMLIAFKLKCKEFWFHYQMDRKGF